MKIILVFWFLALSVYFVVNKIDCDRRVATATERQADVLKRLLAKR